MTVVAAATNAAASVAIASSSLIRHRSAARLLLLCRTGNPRPAARQSTTLECSPDTLPLLLRGPSPLFRRPLVLAPYPDLPAPRWRLFCNRTLAADAEACEKPAAEAGKKIREFRKRLRIVDVKGGPDEGMDRLGQALAIRGWVRTCRVQSSVTFIEVRMQYLKVEHKLDELMSVIAGKAFIFCFIRSMVCFIRFNMPIYVSTCMKHCAVATIFMYVFVSIHSITLYVFVSIHSITHTHI